MGRMILAVLAAAVWMNLSEFVRNELLIKHVWVDGFAAIGLTFPSGDLNGAIWGLWSLIFVSVLAFVCRRFDALSATLILWVPGFLLLWLALWNMGLLPQGLLAWGVPWSFAEVYIAALICRYINPPQTGGIVS